MQNGPSRSDCLLRVSYSTLSADFPCAELHFPHLMRSLFIEPRNALVCMLFASADSPLYVCEVSLNIYVSFLCCCADLSSCAPDLPLHAQPRCTYTYMADVTVMGTWVAERVFLRTTARYLIRANYTNGWYGYGEFNFLDPASGDLIADPDV